mgnify:FL=1
MSGEKFQVAQVIEALRNTKGLVTLAAQRLNCEPDTVRNYAKRHPTVAAALKEERSKMTDVAELSLYNKIVAGEGWAVCFYLKTQGRDRGYVERHEVTGKDGGELVLRVVYDDEKSMPIQWTPDTREIINSNRPSLGEGRG